MITQWMIDKAAMLSELAYEADADIERAETDTQVILRLDEERNCVFVAFRGTSSGKDVRQDLKRIQKDLGRGDVHAGFEECYSSVVHELFYWLRESRAMGRKIIFTGHSLGGALAQLAAYHNHGSICIAFGSPKVGDKRFVQDLWRATELHLFENVCDPVPRLPVFGYAKVECAVERLWSLPKMVGWRPSFHSMALYRELVGRDT